MTPEEIAQKFENRPGFHLVDYAEVGLPIFKLWVDVISLEPREIPTTDEFVLRLISEGVHDADTLRSFLGLERRIFETTLTSLLDNIWITENETDKYMLTTKGRKILVEGADISPQDETISIDFDGITRRPISVGREILSKPSDLKMLGSIEIRPYPASPPFLADLQLADVQKVIRKQYGRQYEAKAILHLNRIARRTKLFRKAVCLVFKASRSKNVEVEFVINGVNSAEHSAEFAKNRGPEKMGFSDSVTSADIRRNLHNLLSPSARKSIPSEEEVGEARIAASAAKIVFEGARHRLERTRGKRTGPEVVEKFEEATEKLRTATDALNRFPIRNLAVYEHVHLLDEALKTSNQNLIISSPRILDSVVDGFFVRSINQLLDKNVAVTFYLPEGPSQFVQNTDGQIKNLFELSKKNKNITFKKTRKSPINWLIKDNDYLAITSFEWLSYKNSLRPIRRVSGLVIQDPDLIKELRQTFLTRELKSLD